MDLKRALPVLLVLLWSGVVYSAECTVVPSAEGVHQLILDTVYGKDAYSPFSSIQDIPSHTEKLERNTIVLVNPQTGEALEVGTGDTAVDVRETLLGNVSSQGPFSATVLLYDTLRIANDIPPSYATEPLLRERFSGRYEVRSYGEGVVKLVEGMLYPVTAPFKGVVEHLKKNPPIENHVVAPDFTVRIVCANSGCRKEIYSLMTKYFNLGASSEMLFEVFGYRVLLSSAQVLGRGASKLAVKVKGEEFEKLLNEYREELIKKVSAWKRIQLEEASKALADLPAEKQELIKAAIVDPARATEVVHKLTPHERAVLYRYLRTTADDLKTLREITGGGLTRKLQEKGIQLRDLAAFSKIESKLNKGEELKDSEKELLKSLADKLKGQGDQLPENPEQLRDFINNKLRDLLQPQQTTDIAQQVEKLKPIKEDLEKIASILPEADTEPKVKLISRYLNEAVDALDKGDTVRAQKNLALAEELAADVAERYRLNAEQVGRYVPVIQSQYDFVGDAVSDALSGETAVGLRSGKGTLSKYVIAPMVFYLFRAGPTALMKPSFAEPGTLDTALSAFQIHDAFQMPPEWTTIDIIPYRESGVVLDVLINHGSDPGDLFKTFLTLAGPGALDRAMKYVFHVSLPGNFFIREEDERTYQMKSAIVTVAVSNTCGSCRLSSSPYGVSFYAPSSTLLALTENSKQDEGSTLITFTRKSKVYANGEMVLDMADEEHSCTKSCNLFKLMPFLKDKPQLAMFGSSLIVGFLLPTLTTSMPLQFIAMPVIYGTLNKGCFDCVDTVFGYYIHARAPAMMEELNSPEDQITSAITSSLKSLGINADLNNLVKGLEKGRIEKKQVMLYAYFPSAQGVLKGRVVSQWARPEEALPTGERTSKVVLVSPEGNLILDRGAAGTERNGEISDVTPAEGASLSVPDSKIPGIIIPSTLLKVSPSTSIILTARSSTDYEIDEGMKYCFTSNGTDLGILKEIVTDKGTIFLDENGISAQTEAWSGKLREVVVYSDFKVKGYGVTIELEDNDVKMKDVEVDLGKLSSIVFEDLSIIQKNGELLAWDRTKVTIPKEAAQQVTVAPSTTGKGLDLSFTPSPDATPQETESLERLNDEMKGVDVIEGSRKAVAVTEDPETGERYLRIYDKEKNTVISEKIIKVLQDENDPTAVKFITQDENGETHEHRVKIDVTADGTPVLKVDGESGGVVSSVQNDRGFLYFDPETGEWKLINGVLAPLAEAFKNGIKMTFEGGIGTGSPSGGIVINTGPREQPGMSLPLLGPELVFLVLGAAIIFFILQ